MRKISEQAAVAFNTSDYFKKDNTEVFVNPSTIYLHGNPIAQRNGDIVKITNAGWFSNLTKERLNSLDGVCINQVNGKWFLNGVEWDGSWIEI